MAEFGRKQKINILKYFKNRAKRHEILFRVFYFLGFCAKIVLFEVRFNTARK
jgi:hypothetical protein